MYSVRRWAVRHARLMERTYNVFEPLFTRLDPLWRLVGHQRLEKPVAAVERGLKGWLFDCRMCGQCALSSTGMACPMNCPKQLRNGPCGGVRQNGHCEVEPDMKCVWVEAWEGSQRMTEKGGARIHQVQPPVDFQLRDTSSWLRVSRQRRQERIIARSGNASGQTHGEPSA